jgi:hypothetical protein
MTRFCEFWAANAMYVLEKDLEDAEPLGGCRLLERRDALKIGAGVVAAAAVAAAVGTQERAGTTQWAFPALGSMHSPAGVAGSGAFPSRTMLS